jgi:two-component system, cell cycle sensor histidine kinase and response regulator CckA
LAAELVASEVERERDPMKDLLTDTPTPTSKENLQEFRVDLQTVLLAHKTELVSEITRAAANQFNNFMMAISSYAELEMKGASSSQRRSLEQVLSNAAQATALVQKLLAISRKQPASPEPEDLNDVVSGVRSLVEQLASGRISVLYELSPDLPMVNADSSEIEQAILSLAINARDAMCDGGKLTISTKLVDLDHQSVGNDAEGTGQYVQLSIADAVSSRTSCTEEPAASHQQAVRANLSLAAVRGIVKNAGGRVRFSCQPEKGSTFDIYFPALKKDAIREDPKQRAFRTAPVARTILVVEDDDAVRIPTSEFLKMNGFKVLQARTGDEAIRVVEQNRSRLDVLITDIVMPKMTGLEVAEKLLELNCDLKILYMSGDADEANRSRAAELPGNTVLRKPFRLDALTARIHELLGE